LIAKIISKKLNCKIALIEENPCLSNYDIVIIVVSNVGDEELPQLMENYLLTITERNKKYIICELGNYFGYENYQGCKNVAIKLLNTLNWQKLSDYSLDTLPSIDIDGLYNWLCQLSNLICIQPKPL
jgi:flavodoxin